MALGEALTRYCIALCFAALPVLAMAQGDDCASAVSLSINYDCSLQAGTTVGLSHTAGNAPSCGNYANNREDGWYSLIVPVSGRLMITTTPSGGTDFEMAVYSGTCAGLTEIGCTTGGAATATMPQLVFTGLTPGSTIYLRIWRAANAPNSFNICAISLPAPAVASEDLLFDFTAGGNQAGAKNRADNAVCFWGQNNWGCCGIGNVVHPQTLPVNVMKNLVLTLGEVDNVISMASGQLHTLVLLDDGTVWSWGGGSTGQLGNGTFAWVASLPVQVLTGIATPLTGIKSLACGSGSSYALDSSGFVWAWGANTRGQLGDGTIVNKAYATLVQKDITWGGWQPEQHYSHWCWNWCCRATSRCGR